MSKCTRLKLEVLLVIASVSFGGSARAGGNFLAGADFSGLAFFESRGITYKDGGQVQDGFHILKNHVLIARGCGSFLSIVLEKSARTQERTLSKPGIPHKPL
jgi:hypothetical protein